jgi:cytochrome c heme-lyase
MPSVEGGCPYKPEGKGTGRPGNVEGGEAPVGKGAANFTGKTAPVPESRCPVKPSRQGKVYDVYSQEINPDNNMPANPNQLPLDVQAAPLSTDRVKSSIPKGGTDDTWTYPSPQMFYNALKRKGKGEDVTEEHMDNVVAVHNSMNEQTWNQILKWESFFPRSNAEERPSLLRFIGRPNDISPKAWLVSTFTSKPVPFDRHDWTVLRGEEEVRYVIDYYYMDDGLSGNTTMPLTATGAFDKGALNEKLIFVDARPALDSWSAFSARVKAALGLAPISEPWVDAKQPHDNTLQPLSHALEVDPSSTDERFRPEALQKMGEWVSSKCATQFEVMDLNCQGENANAEKCQLAAFNLRLCTARVICAKEAADFLEAGNDDENARSDRWDRVENCLDSYTQRAAAAVQRQQQQQQQQRAEVLRSPLSSEEN